MPLVTTIAAVIEEDGLEMELTGDSLGNSTSDVLDVSVGSLPCEALSVEAGGTKEVVVSFAPNPDAVLGSELGVIASFGVSQWAEAALKLVLKGGSPPPLQPETHIALKGFISSSTGR